MNAVIQASASLLSTQIKKHTENFRLACAGDLPAVRGSSQQLEQVIINLVMNALQALPDKKRGVHISTSFDNASSCVTIQVTDEGLGMPPDVLNRVTEPFFTTRLDQGGTGLGLSISYSIIKDHKGSLKFDSEPGRGTRVSVMLPVWQEKGDEG